MPTGKPAGSGINKMDAVRELISKHGKEIKATDIVKLMKEEFGADITLGTASTYKGTILRKQKAGRKRGPKPAAAPTVNSGTAAAVTKSGGGITLEDIRAVKQLADKIGAEKVRQLAEVLAK